MITVRECIVNRREETLKKLITNYKESIPEQSKSLIAWFFYELYMPFDESARRMVSVMFELEIDVNVPYNGKTAIRYALENFDVAAFEWLHEHGGQFGHYFSGDIIQIRSDAPIYRENVIKLFNFFDKFNFTSIIKFVEERRQFEFTANN